MVIFSQKGLPLTLLIWDQQKDNNSCPPGYISFQLNWILNCIAIESVRKFTHVLIMLMKMSTYWYFRSTFCSHMRCSTGQYKVLSETKVTKLGVGRFRSISGHFSANYINSFHKTEFLKVILMGQTYWNLNWIKHYNMNHNFCHFLLFSIL